MLKKLKEELDDTVLKDLDFSERNKAAVRKSFVNKQEQNRGNKRYGLGLVLSLCFTTLFIGFSGYFVLNNLGLSKEEKLSGEKKEVELGGKEGPIRNTHPEPKENYEDMTKEEILHKLFNSVDYFETAAGEFEEYNLFYDGSSSKYTVDYKISNKGVIGGYEKVISHPDPNNPHSKLTVKKTYYNNNKVWYLNLDRNEYDIREYELERKKQIVEANNIFTMDLEEVYDSDSGVYREKPPSMSAFLSLFNYPFVAKYLRDENEWIIEKQNEELLGHNTLVISGTLDENLIDVMQPDEKNFRIWVDKDTGIILKKEIYNEAGELVSYLHSSNLKINKTYEKDEFKPVLDGLQEKKIEIPITTDERENELEVIEHADTKLSDVKRVMGIQREIMPLFYELNDPKITPFSASIEKYQQDNQAYVIYSYDKPENEVGSGSRSLYSRIYTKGTFLRRTGDFERPLGEKIETIEMNGIKWSIYEVEGTSDVHLKGELGEHVFEITTHDVPLNEVKRLLNNFKEIN